MIFYCGAVEFNKKVFLKGKRRVYWWDEHTKWRGNVKDNEAQILQIPFLKVIVLLTLGLLNSMDNGLLINLYS